MSETYDYSRAKLAARDAARTKRERLQLLVSLLFVLALVAIWTYQAVTGVSVVDLWTGLSASAQTIILFLVFLVGGVVFLWRDLESED